MNWKPAFVGALVVIVAGFGVGYAVDRTGKSDTVTVASTVTVATTVTATTPPTTPDPDTETISTPTPPDGTTPEIPDGRATYLSELQDDAIVDEITLGSPPAVTIGHTTFANGTTADELWGYDCDSAATAEYPVRGEQATFVAKLGWTQSSESSAAAIFEVRANGTDGERLYRRTFDGPSEPVEAVVALRGAIKMVLMWQRTDDTCDPASGTFGLGDARIVEG